MFIVALLLGLFTAHDAEIVREEGTHYRNFNKCEIILSDIPDMKKQEVKTFDVRNVNDRYLINVNSNLTDVLGKLFFPIGERPQNIFCCGRVILSNAFDTCLFYARVTNEVDAAYLILVNTKKGVLKSIVYVSLDYYNSETMHGHMFSSLGGDRISFFVHEEITMESGEDSQKIDSLRSRIAKENRLDLDTLCGLYEADGEIAFDNDGFWRDVYYTQ